MSNEKGGRQGYDHTCGIAWMDASTKVIRGGPLSVLTLLWYSLFTWHFACGLNAVEDLLRW